MQFSWVVGSVVLVPSGGQWWFRRCCRWRTVAGGGWLGRCCLVRICEFSFLLDLMVGDGLVTTSNGGGFGGLTALLCYGGRMEDDGSTVVA